MIVHLLLSRPFIVALDNIRLEHRRPSNETRRQNQPIRSRVAQEQSLIERCDHLPIVGVLGNVMLSDALRQLAQSQQCSSNKHTVFIVWR
jgi:hypothetical protein